MILEVCCGNPESVYAAVEGGASRVELCSRLDLDGLTPSWEDLSALRRAFPALRIHVLIRCRAGDFHYSVPEVDVMAADAARARELGADGLVLGALTAGGGVDLPAMERLMAAAGDLPVTFHRAFDRVKEPFRALEEIIGLGCRRILTSGQAPSAREGTDMLCLLRERAGGRIIILPGGGITPENAAWVASATGCTELHASASVEINGIRTTSPGKVARIISALK